MTNVREFENGTFSSLIYLLKMVIFHSYVGLPEGICDFFEWIEFYILHPLHIFMGKGAEHPQMNDEISNHACG